jgi:hypothetical protein
LIDLVQARQQVATPKAVSTAIPDRFQGQFGPEICGKFSA